MSCMWEIHGEEVVNEKTAKAKCKLKSLYRVDDFNDLLDSLMLSEDERNILELKYRHNKTISYIADMLGMSESSVKKKHTRAMEKIARMSEIEE